ncbi:MAG: hypothetical protein MUE77_12200 [Sandarakinorhabdus sp.]|jgi:hypothetical protein|nr:hypothetical protein [Sandarakinorhabdus sp.]
MLYPLAAFTRALLGGLVGPLHGFLRGLEFVIGGAPELIRRPMQVGDGRAQQRAEREAFAGLVARL